MKKSLILLLLLTLVGAPIATIAKEKSEIPEYTVEGLKLVPDTKGISLVWAEPGIDLSQYQRVYLAEPYVAFKKNWQRDYNRSTTSLSNRVSSSDMENIKTRVKDLFMEVFTEELNNGGYTLATERAEDVLIVKPAIIDLDPNAPDIMSAGRNKTYAQSAGSMTLYIELFDSETDDLLAKALDAKEDRDHAYMQWQTGPANRTAASRMMKSWAEALREALDNARETTP